MHRQPYLVAVASHKGGTGRTTTALALSWIWGQAGFRVTLADPNPVHAASLIALTPAGECPWPNVRVTRDFPGPGWAGRDDDLIVIDTPSLTEPAAQRVLRQCDGVVLTCLADPLTLRTVPAASAAIQAAREARPQLELLGILIGIFHDADRLQAHMIDHVRRSHGELLLEPPVPHHQAVSNWALSPGSGLPPGPAGDAYTAVAHSLEALIGVTPSDTGSQAARMSRQ